MNRQRFSYVAATILALVAAWTLASCSSNSPTSSGGGGGNPPPPNAVNISGFAFNPSSLTVKAGTKVTWTNSDSATHTVTSNDGTFTSSGNLGQGAVYQFTFMTAGTYHYHCSIHPTMTGTITVTP